MKKIILISLLLLVGYQTEVLSQPCLPEGITFYAQSQIDSFQINYPGCTEIEGDVLISGDDITNLNVLSVITSIGGDLEVVDNDVLTNLTGLNNLDSIGGDIEISWNTSLSSLTGLEKLTAIEGRLRIGYDYYIYGLGGNNSLKSLTGLENLTSIGGNLEILSNDSLISLSGLDNISSIGGELYIYDNYALTTLTSLKGVTTFGGSISIGNNDLLTSLTGLGNIKPDSIYSITIRDNPVLSTCAVQSICDYLASPTGTTEIHDNAPGCNSQEEVEKKCDTLSVDDFHVYDELSIYPSPFATSATLQYNLTEPLEVQITICNHLGQEVEVLVNEIQQQGDHRIRWNAEGLPAGIYLIRMQVYPPNLQGRRAGNRVETKKIIKL